MKVKLVHPFRQGTHYFKKDEIGLTAEVPNPNPVFDFYVKFPSYTFPVGVHKSEVETLEESNGRVRCHQGK